MASVIDTSDLQSSMKDLKCFYCNKYLSVSPVFLLEEIKVCGRCKVSTYDKARSEQYTRQMLYEQVAKYLKFPCSFDETGCDKQMYWQDVKVHELNCNFKPLQCPIYFKENFPNIVKKCKFTGDHNTLGNHIKEDHSNYTHKSGQFTSKLTKLLFAPLEGQIFTACIVQQKNEKIYKVLVLKHTNVEDYSCQLEIYGPNKEILTTLSNSNISLYQNQLENLDNLENTLEIDLSQFNKLKNFKKFDGKLSFIKIEKNPEVKEINLKRKKSFDEEMLVELECPVCNEYMIPPIFICVSGHSICSVCKPKVNSCPTCRSALAGARNYTLEKLTTKVNYPCRYQSTGCIFVTTSDKIREHENNCTSVGQQCLLKCHWKGLITEMFEHMKLKHAASIIENNKVYKQEFITIPEPFNILIYDDEMFRVGVKVITGTRILKFNIQHCPTSDNSNKYKYKLEFIDLHSLGIKFETVYFCQEITRLPKDMWLNCLNISEEITKPFLENNFLSYKINILKL